MLSPLHDRVIVRPVEAKSMTDGGLYIPDKAQEKPRHGVVLAVGPGKRNRDGEIVPLCLKPEDEILYGKYAGTEVEIDGAEVVILREEEVLAVIHGSA